MSQDAPLPAGIGTSDIPLPTRWYKYRDKILRYRQLSHLGDEQYWALLAAKKGKLV